MVEQENALYQGKLWCAYELKDNKGQYKEELRLAMRIASQNHELICPVCKQPIILCAGMIREPYLRHHSDSDCSVRTNGNNGDYQRARRILYQLAKRSFEEATVICSQKFDQYIADICVIYKNQTYVMEYLSYDMKLVEWLSKHEYYEKQGIIDIWFLNSKKYCFEAPTTFEYLISTKKHILNILDTEHEELTLKKILRLPGRSSGHIVDRTYLIATLQLDYEGCFLCDFEEYFALELEKELHMEQERKKKYPIGLREARIIKQEHLSHSLQPESTLHDEQNESGRQYLSNQVYRLPLQENKLSALIMKIPAIDECWKIPQLRGTTYELEYGNKARYDYLHELNERLMMLDDEDMKEQMIDEAIYYLEEMIEAKMWM